MIKPSLKAGAAALLLGLGGLAHGIVIVTLDDFSTGAQVSVLPAGPASTTVAAAVPGGLRTVTVTRNVGALSTTAAVLTGGPGVFSLSNDAGTQGDADVVWDAGGAGLGGADIVVPGFSNLAFSLDVTSIDQGLVDLLMTVEDTGGNSDTVAAANPGIGPVAFPYSAFSGVDFMMVDSIVLTVETRGNASDLTLDLFGIEGDRVQEVPEPATLVLLGIGLAGLGFASRRRTRRGVA